MHFIHKTVISSQSLFLVTAAVIISTFSCTPFDISSAAGEKNINITLDAQSYKLMDPVIINWSSDFDIPSVRIELWQANRALEILADNVETETFNTWTIHSGLETGDDYKLRVISTTDPTLYGQSDEFVIDVSYLIQVTLDSSRYVMFEYPSIDWTADIPVENVKLELLSDGSPIETLTDTNTTGNFSGWQVHQGASS